MRALLYLESAEVGSFLFFCASGLNLFEGEKR